MTHISRSLWLLGAGGMLWTSALSAQTGVERVGDWSVAKIAVSEGGNVCSALRTYGRGYALELIQARGLPGQLIMRIESPQITYRPGQTGEEIEPGVHLEIVIGTTSGQEGAEAIVRNGPRGLGFVTVLREGSEPRFSPIRGLRTGQAVRAYIAFADGSEDKRIGIYSLAGSGPALDALARCTNGGAGGSPSLAPAPSKPVPPAMPKPALPPTIAKSLPVPFGRYADNDRCSNAHMILSPKYWGDDADGEGYVIGPFRNLGGDRWALSGAVTIVVTGPKSFTFRGRKMFWCGS